MSPGQQPPATTITEDEFRRCRDFLYRRTGLYFTEARRYYLDRRIAERMAATGSASFQAWYTLLLAGAGQEVERLINAVTVNETYFLREDYQFRALQAEMLPEIAARKRPGEAMRLWSIPCASGEECYSLAIWLLEYWAEVDRYEVEIIGSDIDTAALRAAAAGVYGARSLARLPPALLARYFTPTGQPGEYRVIPALRESLRFTRANLVDPASMAGQRDCDVIFCRNLLIYFDEASRRLAAENLYDSLAPGGFLCLGHSESMSRISSLFTLRRFAGAIVYQKPLPGAGHAG